MVEIALVLSLNVVAVSIVVVGVQWWQQGVPIEKRSDADRWSREGVGSGGYLFRGRPGNFRVAVALPETHAIDERLELPNWILVI